MLYVSVGRDVDGTPMSYEDWCNFRMRVEECVMDNEKLVTADTYATGGSRWGETSEECMVLVWFDFDSALLRQTEEELAEIAKAYGQEAIAWAVAETQFVVGVDKARGLSV